MTRVARRRRRAQERRGWIYITVAALGFLAIGAAAITFSVRERKTDKVSGCPTDHYDSVTAVLVDVTDPLDPTQSAALRNAMLKIRDATPKFGRLEIYALGPVQVRTLTPIFAACSPGSGEDVDSSLYGNPELADRIWKQRFGDKVAEVVNRLGELAPQANSPILEGVKSVSVTAFGNPLARNAKTKKFILISDLIQNSAQLSMYHGVPDFDAFRHSPYFQETRPALRGADVELVPIEREAASKVQDTRWRDFWISYFQSLNDSVERWVRVEAY